MDHAFGGANLLHLRALARQDARNQNGAARMMAERLAAVNQLGRSKLEGHRIESRKSKFENRNPPRASSFAFRIPTFESQLSSFDFRVSGFEFPSYM
jgi:hypothetical protein